MADIHVVAVTHGAPPAEMVAELCNLHRLLSLECTADLGSDEAGLFCAIYPDDPRADETRLCAEARERGPAALAAVTAAGVDSQEAA